MTKNKWKLIIIDKSKEAGTYQETFDPVIDVLSELLAQRDKVFSQYKKDGSKAVVEYTNKAGAKNYVKNPMLTMWNDLNKNALAYWRDLGLTPASLNKIDSNAIQVSKNTSAMDALAQVLDEFNL